MLLLAGTMTFMTSCGDDETPAEAEEGKKQQAGGSDGNSGNENQNGGNENDDQDFEPVPGISITELSKNKTKILGAINTAVEPINQKDAGSRSPDENNEKVKLDELAEAAKEIKLDGNDKTENNVDDALALLAIYAKFLNITKQQEDKNDTTKKTRADILSIAAKVIQDVKHDTKGKSRKNDKIFKKSKKTKELESRTKFSVDKGHGKEVVDTLKNNTVFNVTIDGLNDKQSFTIDKKSFNGLETACKK